MICLFCWAVSVICVFMHVDIPGESNHSIAAGASRAPPPIPAAAVAPLHTEDRKWRGETHTHTHTHNPFPSNEHLGSCSSPAEDKEWDDRRTHLLHFSFPLSRSQVLYMQTSTLLHSSRRSHTYCFHLLSLCWSVWLFIAGCWHASCFLQLSACEGRSRSADERCITAVSLDCRDRGVYGCVCGIFLNLCF